MTRRRFFQPWATPALALIWAFLSACLHFKNERLESYYDPVSGGNILLLEFELADGREALQALRSAGSPDHRCPNQNHSGVDIYPDGATPTCEETSALSDLDDKPSVLVLLDVSSSMYQKRCGEQRAIEAASAAVDKFTEQFRQEGYSVSIALFARERDLVPESSTASASYPQEERSENKFTALYDAIEWAYRERPEKVIVVFSDGADNVRSPGRPDDLGRLVADVRRARAEGRRLHTIAFGIDTRDHDKDLHSANVALRRLTRAGGGIQFENNKEERQCTEGLDEGFLEIGNAIRNTFSFKWRVALSDGNDHEVRLRTKDDLEIAWSKRLGYRAAVGIDCETSSECRVYGDRLVLSGESATARSYYDHALHLARIEKAQSFYMGSILYRIALLIDPRSEDSYSAKVREVYLSTALGLGSLEATRYLLDVATSEDEKREVCEVTRRSASKRHEVDVRRICGVDPMPKRMREPPPVVIPPEVMEPKGPKGRRKPAISAGALYDDDIYTPRLHFEETSAVHFGAFSPPRWQESPWKAAEGNSHLSVAPDTHQRDAPEHPQTAEDKHRANLVNVHDHGSGMFTIMAQGPRDTWVV